VFSGVETAHTMCTLVILIRPGHAWPVVLAANRDERLDRSWDPPAAWWNDRPGLIAGRDRFAGGTWMGINRHGLLAAVLNREGSLGPEPGKRSRGELPLIALTELTAAAAARVIEGLNANEWRSFNLVLADAAGAMFLRGVGHGRPEGWALRAGVSFVTGDDPNSANCPRRARHLQRFIGAPAPEPGDWSAWHEILSDRSGAPSEQINVAARAGYGTTCSSFIAWPAAGPPVWLFAAGPPNEATFRSVGI
jgi:hypothetical protein